MKNLYTSICRILLVFLALFYSMVAVADTSAAVEITDAIGRKVKVQLPVKRVVLNFNFEEFTAVAGKENWSKVVGISRAPWEGWRPVIFKRYTQVIPNLQAMPDIGHSEDGTFSAEKIIALKPDVVFMAEWTFSALANARQQIEAAGIPVVVIDYNAQLLERHLVSTRVIGKIMGTSPRAEELASMYEREYNKIITRIASLKPSTKKKVYVELGQAGPETVGNSYSGTMWGKIVTLLGAENIADGKLKGPWGPLNQEAVVVDDPDLIFIAGSSWVNKPKAVKTGYEATLEQTRASLMPYAKRELWAGMKAVKNKNVHAIEHGLCRTLYDFVAMQYMAKQLYPEAFKDLDPHLAFKNYHEKYLPVSYSGTWMASVQP
jgi:iron complex transport system substrate-binding protein